MYNFKNQVLFLVFFYMVLYIFIVALFLFEANEMIHIEEEDESQIAGTPSELQAFANHDSIHISWLPPRDDNVLIRGFQVFR
jgi:hypothetical protein